MPDLKTEIIEVLRTAINDFDYIIVTQRILNGPYDKIADVWSQQRNNMLSVISQIDSMTIEQISGKLGEYGLSAKQLEWEI